MICFCNVIFRALKTEKESKSKIFYKVVNSETCKQNNVSSQMLSLSVQIFVHITPFRKAYTCKNRERCIKETSNNVPRFSSDPKKMFFPKLSQNCSFSGSVDIYRDIILKLNLFIIIFFGSNFG